jgi:hypothetical protein
LAIVEKARHQLFADIVLDDEEIRIAGLRLA